MSMLLDIDIRIRNENTTEVVIDNGRYKNQTIAPDPWEENLILAKQLMGIGFCYIIYSVILFSIFSLVIYSEIVIRT